MKIKSLPTLVFVTLGMTMSHASAALMISEIMYNPASTLDNDWEWVELYNSGSSTIDLTGYVIDDINSIAQTGSNLSGSIAANSVGVLYDADSLSISEFTNAWGAGLNLIGVSDWSRMALNNGGDQISIWDSFADYSGDNTTHANAILTQEYNNSSPWPSISGSGLASIYLPDLTADATDGSNWALSVAGVDGAYASNPAGDNNATNVGSPGVVPVAVPEPSIIALFAAGLFGLGFARRRKA